MPLVNCIICFVNHALLPILSYSLLKLGVCVRKMPQWVKPMPSLICVNPKDFAGHTYLVLHQVKISTINVIIKIREANGRLCIEEVGVDLEPLCSCPWTRCRSYHGSFSYNNYPLVINSSGIRGRGSDHVSPWFRFSCKFERLSSAEQYPSPTSTLICRRVLPPGISRLSWNCITSYEFFIKCYILTDSNFPRALRY